MTAELTREELEVRIADVADNLRELIERATATIGAADDERSNEQIEEQQALFERLIKRRDAIDQAEQRLV